MISRCAVSYQASLDWVAVVVVVDVIDLAAFDIVLFRLCCCAVAVVDDVAMLSLMLSWVFCKVMTRRRRKFPNSRGWCRTGPGDTVVRTLTARARRFSNLTGRFGSVALTQPTQALIFCAVVVICSCYLLPRARLAHACPPSQAPVYCASKHAHLGRTIDSHWMI